MYPAPQGVPQGKKCNQTFPRVDMKGRPIIGANNQCTNPEQQAMYDQQKLTQHKKILDELLPLLNQIINSNGGVMRIESLAARAPVRNMMNRMQPPHAKALTDLLTDWNEYFLMMPAGIVGTNLGYDSGLIMEDGSLNSDYIWKFVSPSESKDKGPDAHDSLVHLADALFHAIMDLSSEEPLMAAFNALRQKRGQMVAVKPDQPKVKPMATQGQIPLQSGPGADDALLLPPEQRQEWIIMQIIQWMRKIQGKSMHISQIFADAGPMKNGIFVKGKEFLERYPTLFSIHGGGCEGGIDNYPPISVTLLDAGGQTGDPIEIPAPLPQQYVPMWQNPKRPRYDGY